MSKAKKPVKKPRPTAPKTPKSLVVENWPVNEGADMNFIGSWAIARDGGEFYGQALVYLNHAWPHVYNFTNGKLTKDSVSARREDGLSYSAAYEGIAVLEGKEYRRYGGRSGGGGFVVHVPNSSVK